MNDRADDRTLSAVVACAVDARRGGDGGQDDRRGPLRLAIAYSGGADSTALLHAVASLAQAGAIDVVALHVHHGLHPSADRWLEHCRDQARAFGVAFDHAQVVVGRDVGSLEADARSARYAALVRLCHAHDRRVLWTAHHADDQAETVLVNLVRGTGVAGLAGAARTRVVDRVVLERPLLETPVATLRAHVDAHALAFVDDPSNADRRFTRNAIRHEVMPALRRIAPSIASHLVRTAGHAAMSQRLLDEIGREDLGLASGTDDGDVADGRDELDVDRLAGWSQARAANALRVWLARRGMRAPSTAVLDEMLDQLLHASADAQIALIHERRVLRLYRGRVSVDADVAPRPAITPFAWHGEASVDLPGWSGRLVFRQAADGEAAFDGAALRDGPLTARSRQGGERLRMHPGGPRRTLKNLYQEAGIPAWQRARLPLVFRDRTLLFAAGIGPDHAASGEASMPGLGPVERIAIEWRPLVAPDDAR